MDAQVQSRVVQSAQNLPFEVVAPVLQGGGALGAYQAGVYEALSEAGIEPNWIAGISIGARYRSLLAELITSDARKFLWGCRLSACAALGVTRVTVPVVELPGEKPFSRHRTSEMKSPALGSYRTTPKPWKGLHCALTRSMPQRACGCASCQSSRTS